VALEVETGIGMIFLLSTIGGAARSSHVFVCSVCFGDVLGAATARTLCTAISKRLEYFSRLLSWLGRFLLPPNFGYGDLVTIAETSITAKKIWSFPEEQ
jgi:hypothetical protein